MWKWEILLEFGFSFVFKGMDSWCAHKFDQGKESFMVSNYVLMKHLMLNILSNGADMYAHSCVN